MKLKKYYFLLYIILILSIIISIVNSYNFYINDLIKNKIMFFLPSILVLIASYIIRFIVIDINKSIEVINNTYPFKSKNTDFKKYINSLFVAMHIGLFATITIHYHFLIGAVIYFFMHIAIIFAFSGIINLDFRVIKENRRIFISYLLNFIFWFFVSNIIFFFFAYKRFSSFIFLPYAYILGLMTCISFLGLFYTKRSIMFRAITALGALIFLISDTFISYAGKKEMDTIVLYFINPTYTLSIIMLTYSQLFIKKSNKGVCKEIKRLRKITDEKLIKYNEKSIKKRLEWFKKNRSNFDFINDDLLYSAYKLLLCKFNIDESEMPIIERTDKHLIFHSKNFCPTLEACKILNLDTRKICKRYNETSTDILVKQIDKRLKFTRNYSKLRPNNDYCEEMIILEDKLEL